MTDIKVTIEHFKKARLADFLSPEEKDSLTDEDLSLIERIENDIMPGGFLIPNLSQHHTVRYNKRPEAVTTFIHWGNVLELAQDDDSLYFHTATATYPIGFENPVVLKGAYNLFGWCIKDFFQHPLQRPYKTETEIVPANKLKTTT